MLQLTLLAVVLGAALLSQWTSLAGLVFVASVFQAASVMNVVTAQAAVAGTSAYGVPPALVLSVVAVGLWTLGLMRGVLRSGMALGWRQALPITGALSWPLRWLAAYVLVAVVGAFVLPYWFAGTPVNSLAAKYGVEAVTPLLPTLSNKVQAINLFLHCGVLFYLLSAVQTQGARGRLVAGMVMACGLVIAIGFFEQLVPFMKWTSLASVLANNPGYHQAAVAPTDFVLSRVGLPFSEPSYASAYMAAMAVGVVAVALLGRGWWWSWAAGLVCMASWINTLGSTGLAAGAVAFAILGMWAVVMALRPATQWSRRWRAALICVLLLVASVWGGRLYETSTWRPQVDTMVQRLLVDKAKNTDGVRAETNIRALEIVKETYGLGVGLGSNRASSFAASMVSNTGVLGLAFFAAMLGSLLWRYVRAPVLSDMQIFVAAALPTATLSMCLGIPDLNMPMYWGFIFLGFVFCPGNEADDKGAGDGCPPARA
jgi:hypothetical protein